MPQLRTTLQRTLGSPSIAIHLVPLPYLASPSIPPPWLLISSNPLCANLPPRGTSIIIPILPTRKRRLRGVACLAYHCTFDEGQVRACPEREEARTPDWLGLGWGRRVGGQTPGKASPAHRPVLEPGEIYSICLSPHSTDGETELREGTRYIQAHKDGPRGIF